MMANTRLSAHGGRRGALVSLRAAFGAVALWHQRARQRRQLSVLEDRLYSDIGVTAGDAHRESQKPFWRA